MLTVLYPVSLIAAESGVQFRQRVSTNDEEVASDVTEEVRFGREVAARVIARYGLYDNPALMKYVNLVGHVLSQADEPSGARFPFRRS